MAHLKCLSQFQARTANKDCGIDLHRLTPYTPKRNQILRDCLERTRSGCQPGQVACWIVVWEDALTQNCNSSFIEGLYIVWMYLRCRMRQLPMLEWIIVLICLDIPTRDLHERQCGACLLFHWDLIWVNFVPVKRSPETVIATASILKALQTI